MTINIEKSLAIRTGLAVAMALAVLTPGMAQPAEPLKSDKVVAETQTKDHARMHHPRMHPSKTMMIKCQEMMADLKTQDGELLVLIAGMNAAPKEAKVDLMAAIVTKMGEQRAAMDTRMTEMHLAMMKHMHKGMESAPHHPKMKDMDKKPAESDKAKK